MSDIVGNMAKFKTKPQIFQNIAKAIIAINNNLAQFFLFSKPIDEINKVAGIMRLKNKNPFEVS
jgi:hypothetical protein